MQKLIVSLFFILSLCVSANEVSCFEKVENYFKEKTSNYIYHSVSDEPTLLAGTELGYDYYNRYIETNYGVDVNIYTASNEYWSAIGIYHIHATVEDCEILRMIEVYSE